jgi:hypothetical protein
VAGSGTTTTSGKPRELVDPEAATLHESRWEHPVAAVEAVDRAGEIGTVVHRGARAGSRYVLTARDPVLVDENKAHRPQPKLLDARRNLGRCPRLLVGIQVVAIDEPSGSKAEAQTVAHVRSSCR